MKYIPVKTRQGSAEMQNSQQNQQQKAYFHGNVQLNKHTRKQPVSSLAF